jgi:MFS family permease
VPLLQFLGSWRYTFLLYSAVVGGFALAWWAFAKMPPKFSVNKKLEKLALHSSLKAGVHVVIKCKDVLFMCGANLLDGVTAWGIMTLIPIINQVLKGLKPGEASVVSFPLYLGAMIGMLSCAPILKIFKSKKLMLIIRAILTALFTYLINIISAKPIWVYMSYMFILGIFSGWFPVLNSTYIMELPEIGPTLSPVALGLTNMFGIGIGGFLGPLLMGYIPSTANLVIMYAVIMACSAIFYIPLKETYIE